MLDIEDLSGPSNVQDPNADDDDDMPELDDQGSGANGNVDLVDRFKNLGSGSGSVSPADFKDMLNTLDILRSKLQEKDEHIERMLQV